MKSAKKILGGWWMLNWCGQKAVGKIVCQTPVWKIYSANVEARKGCLAR